MTKEALTMAIWTMILCSVGWVLFGTFSANKMEKIEHKLSKGNAGTLTTIASTAIIGVFAAMVASHLSKPIYFLMQKADAAAMGGANKNAIACILGDVWAFDSSGEKEYWLVKRMVIDDYYFRSDGHYSFDLMIGGRMNEQ